MPQRNSSKSPQPKHSKFWGEIRTSAKPSHARATKKNTQMPRPKLESHQLRFETTPIQTEIPKTKAEMLAEAIRP
jgi:hypothetical protein